MDFSERNRKVALSRWSKIHSKQKEMIPNDSKSLLLKAAICGFLAGDGSVQKRKDGNFYHHQIDFFPDNKLMLETYIKQIKKIYDKTPSIKVEKNYYSVRFNSRIVLEDLSNISKFGLRNWNLPKSLFKIKGAKENWLKAFFSAEAYVGKKAIKVQTINQKSMKKVSNLLKGLGIENNYYEYNSKKVSDSPVGIIMITRISSRLKYHDSIGFWHSKKTLALKESLDL